MEKHVCCTELKQIISRWGGKEGDVLLLLMDQVLLGSNQCKDALQSDTGLCSYSKEMCGHKHKAY